MWRGADAQPQGSGVTSTPGGTESPGLKQTFTVHFRLRKSNIDTAYLDNAQEFQSIFRGITRAKELYGIDSVTILTTSSPEGDPGFNKKLIGDRASSMRKYITDNFPLISQESLHIRTETNTWDAVRESVEADPKVPMRSEVLKILGSNASDAQKEAQLMALGDNREVFYYISYNILRYMRQAVVVVACPPEETAPEPQPAPVVEAQPVEEQKPVEVPAPVEPAVTAEPPVVAPAAKPSHSFPCCLRVKSNAALLAMTVINAGVEACVGSKISIDLPLVYNPVTISRKWKLRTVFFQPELRYWFGNNRYYGHFIGLRAGVGWYNLAFLSDYRYQDKGGRTPIWNAGLSYGYAMALSKRWGLEFTLGAGYNHTRYDMFFNIPDGALYDTRRVSGLGITRAGINLIYKIW